MDSEHGHMDSEHGHVDGEHGHMDEAPMAVVHAHDHAQVAHNHNKQVGSFSLVHDGMAIEPLAFGRWVRKVSTARAEDVGVLYRCKGVLAQLGSHQRLAFHAVVSGQ
mmetsp:Transcript_72923/g.193793  ORF Transcript_72923/g.193793 Transcript_72923/m.193793 type:complete len:107 (+) Transcript_72923:3-323(+)